MTSIPARNRSVSDQPPVCRTTIRVVCGPAPPKDRWTGPFSDCMALPSGLTRIAGRDSRPANARCASKPSLRWFVERRFISLPGSDRQTEKGPVNGPFSGFHGTPYRIRTGVTAVRGRRPEPLDEGSAVIIRPDRGSRGLLLYGRNRNPQDHNH